MNGFGSNLQQHSHLTKLIEMTSATATMASKSLASISSSIAVGMVCRVFVSCTVVGDAVRHPPECDDGQQSLHQQKPMYDRVPSCSSVAHLTLPASIALIDVFSDPIYARTSLLLRAAPTDDGDVPIDDLVHAASTVTSTFLEKLDISKHYGTHPRLGSVDHIVFHPIEMSPDTHLNDQNEQESQYIMHKLSDTAAEILAKKLHERQKLLPIYLYGPTLNGIRLQQVRRKLGYFQQKALGLLPTATNQSQGKDVEKQRHQSCGLLPESNDKLSFETCDNLHPCEVPLEPDFGPAKFHQHFGVACIGSTPWVTNLNIGITTGNYTIAQKLSRRISARYGGIPAVESLALKHNNGMYEIACNLLSSNANLVDQVLASVQKGCQELEPQNDSSPLEIRNHYIIGGNPQQIRDAPSLSTQNMFMLY